MIDLLVLILVAATASWLLTIVSLYLAVLVAWRWGRPHLTCSTSSVGVAPRRVYGFRRIVSALRRRGA